MAPTGTLKSEVDAVGRNGRRKINLSVRGVHESAVLTCRVMNVPAWMRLSSTSSSKRVWRLLPRGVIDGKP